MEKIIKKYVLENAVSHNGKANPGAIIGKLIAEDKSFKSKIKETMPQIQKIVKEVNQLDKDQQLSQLESLAPELLEKKTEKKEGLKELRNAKKGEVIMRFEPSPSGPFHIGHAYVGCLISQYCDDYDGKYILRISDTNANNIYSPAYKMLEEDANWLFGNIKEVIIQSERIERYYEIAEKLIKEGYMYICTCSQEDFKNFKDNKKDCPCRNYSSQKQLLRWEKMLKMYNEGEAVVRFKTSMQHKNPAMRDFPCLRICDSEHPRQGKKYRVWPLMLFSVSVDDYDSKMTHILRGKDHMDNAKKENLIFDALDFKHPETIFVGRINFEGFEVSSSKTRKKIEEGIYDGWDDIRIPFIPALKRRGYQPEAFKKYAVDVGATQNDKSVAIEEFFKVINHFNKEIIEPKAHRYFFIKDPVEISIKDSEELKKGINVELDLHPDNKKGGREFECNDKFIITKEDFNSIKQNEVIRLMDCVNVIKKNEDFYFHSKDYEIFKENGKQIIHWLPKNDDYKLNEVEILMPDHSTVFGFGEHGLKDLKIGDIIQFERFGFVRLDNINDGKLKFWYLHG